MEYMLSISRDGELVVQLGVSADEALIAIGQAIPKTTLAAENQLTPTGAKKKYRKRSADSEVMRGAVRHHPMTDEIERMLIDGKPVAEIAEACEASKPTVYVIKARLKNDGRLLN